MFETWHPDGVALVFGSFVAFAWARTTTGTGKAAEASTVWTKRRLLSEVLQGKKCHRLQQLRASTQWQSKFLASVNMHIYMDSPFI